jgi:hypothetical protein
MWAEATAEEDVVEPQLRQSTIGTTSGAKSAILLERDLTVVLSQKI